MAGKYIFVIAQDNQLIAMNRLDGRIKWVNALPNSHKAKKKNFWSGPVMAGGKLVIAGSKGKLLVIDPQTGAEIKTVKIPPGIFTAPRNRQRQTLFADERVGTGGGEVR